MADEPVQRFEDTDGGLNQMTIRRFKKIIAQSDFTIARFETVPIRPLRWLANPLTRDSPPPAYGASFSPARPRGPARAHRLTASKRLPTLGLPDA